MKLNLGRTKGNVGRGAKETRRIRENSARKRKTVERFGDFLNNFYDS